MSLRSGSGCGQTGLNLSAVRTPSQRVTGLVGGRKRSSPPSSDAYSSPRYASTGGSVGSGRLTRIPRRRPYRVVTTRRLICVEKTFPSTEPVHIRVSASSTRQKDGNVAVGWVPVTATRLSAVIQGMFDGRHGSHGRPTDCATTDVVITPIKSAVDGVQLTINSTVSFRANIDLLQVVESSNSGGKPHAGCGMSRSQQHAVEWKMDWNLVAKTWAPWRPP